ncbi:MAG: hypothetical protein AAFY26_26515, partial [Cyanobacteria bacterium J06638_22]
FKVVTTVFEVIVVAEYILEAILPSIFNLILLIVTQIFKARTAIIVVIFIQAVISFIFKVCAMVLYLFAAIVEIVFVTSRTAWERRKLG